MLFLRSHIPAFLFYSLTINLAHVQTYEISDGIEPSEIMQKDDDESNTKALGLPNVPGLNTQKIIILPGLLTVTPTLAAIFTTTIAGDSGDFGGSGGSDESDGSDGSDKSEVPPFSGDYIGKSSLDFNDKVFPLDTPLFDNILCGNATVPIVKGALVLPDLSCLYEKCRPSQRRAVYPVRTLGQSVVWDTLKLKVFFVDKFGRQIIEYCPKTGIATATAVLGVTLNAILPTRKLNKYIVVSDNRIVAIETVFFSSGIVSRFKHIYVTFDPAWSLGVAKTDMDGRLWIAAKFKTDCESSKIFNYIYMINNGVAQIKETKTGVTGGMAWAEKFYFLVDVDRQYIYKYNYERKTGDISNRKIIFDMRNHQNLRGVLNDIVLDSKDQIWATVFRGKKIIQVDSISGKVLQAIELSTNYYPVSLAFGGLRQEKLYVTTAYGDNPKIVDSTTMVFYSLNAKGKSVTKAIDTNKVFGNATINVNFPDAADCESGFVTSKDIITTLRYNCNSNCLAMPNISNINNKFSCRDGSKNCVVQRLRIDVETYGNSLHYDSSDNALYMADVYGPSFIKRNLLTGYTSVMKLKDVSSAVGIIPIKNKLNKFIATEDQSIVIYESNFLIPEGISRPHKKVLYTLQPKNCELVFTKAKVDCKGRLWTGVHSGTVIPKDDGKVLVFIKDTMAELNLPEIKSPGGMAWSKNDKRFFLADRTSQTVYSYAFNSDTGDINSPKTFYVSEIDGVFASDLEVDNDDFVWATMYGNSTVVRINPRSGKVVRTITIPSEYPTSLEFGGMKRDVLYVTTAHGFECTEKNAASTYAIHKLGVRAGKKKTNKFVC